MWKIEIRHTYDGKFYYPPRKCFYQSETSCRRWLKKHRERRPDHSYYGAYLIEGFVFKNDKWAKLKELQ